MHSLHVAMTCWLSIGKLPLGLIIDSFGKLRNKEEAQKEEMQVAVPTCGA